VVSIDRFSGLLHWSVDVECGGLTVTGDALHFASGGKGGRLLTSLDIFGAHRWTVEVDGAFDEVFAPLVADDTLFVGTTSDQRDAELIALRPGTDSGLAFPAVTASDTVPASAGTGAAVEAPISEAIALVPDCTPFANYDEAQIYYATYPQARSIIDPDEDGLACEGYFFGGDPVVAEAPADTGTTGGSSGGDTGGNTGGSTGGGGNTGGSTGGGIIYTEFGGLDGVDYDCYDFATPADAQAYFVADGGSVYNNSDGLDRNHNGLACEPGEFD